MREDNMKLVEEMTKRLRNPQLADRIHSVALHNEAADLIAHQATEIERKDEALKPFADFADLSGAGYLPNDHTITLGSGMAARQLTMGDCRKARAALSTPSGGRND